MNQISRSDGTVRFTLPEHVGVPRDFELEPIGSEAPRSRSRSRRASDATASDRQPAGVADEGIDDQLPIDEYTEELRTIVAALTEERSRTRGPSSGPEVVDAFIIDLGESDAGEPRTRGRGDNTDGGASPTEGLRLEVDVAEDETAVMLLESDGSYEWVFPAALEAATDNDRSRSRGRFGSNRTVVFNVDPDRLQRLADDGPRSRGLIDKAKNLGNRIAGVVLKFIGDKAIGALTSKLESGVEAGLVHINSATTPEDWPRIHDTDGLTLPSDRPARILLLVHGTFSSTLGSFGALGTHDKGRSLLQTALGHYDAILGYDHHTLSATPEENAVLILEQLQALRLRAGKLHVDAICFSRGGLVYRYLTERVAGSDNQGSDRDLVFKRAIFIGCANAGTGLADPENWKQLVDCYTNLVAGATRVLGLAPTARLPAQVLRQSIKAIGSLVIYMTQKDTLERQVPGIAAMQPMGDIVNLINHPATPPSHGRTVAAASTYYALGADFEPTGEQAASLGKRFVLRIGDGVIDRLMGEKNDLVVDTDSMFVIDPLADAAELKRHQLSADSGVFHTGYFAEPLVAAQVLDWLEIEVMA